MVIRSSLIRIHDSDAHAKVTLGAVDDFLVLAELAIALWVRV